MSHSLHFVGWNIVLSIFIVISPENGVYFTDKRMETGYENVNFAGIVSRYLLFTYREHTYKDD